MTRQVSRLNQATGAPLAIGFCSAGLPQDSAHAVLLDPPWYMDFIRLMLAAAAAACRLGGVVLLSVPPAATRPSAEADRAATLNFALRLGLELICDEPLGLSYETPFFEANALAASGLFPPGRWRRGDLLIFRKTRRLLGPRQRPAGAAIGLRSQSVACGSSSRASPPTPAARTDSSRWCQATFSPA